MGQELSPLKFGLKHRASCREAEAMLGTGQEAGTSATGQEAGTSATARLSFLPSSCTCAEASWSGP